MSTRHCGILAAGARVFGLGAVLVLAAAELDPSHALAVLLLAGLVAVALLATHRAFLNGTLVAIAEALVAAVIIGTQIGDLPYAMLYLVIPPFIAGLYAGIVGSVGAWLIEVVVVSVLTAPALSLAAVGDRVELSAPWVLTSVGTGALGAWLRQIDHPLPRDHDAYHSARRLLAELRTVARSLSAGLDPVGIAEQMLVEVHEAINDEAAVVLVRAEGGILVPLTQDEGNRLRAIGSDDPVVMECWTTESPVQEIVGGSSGRRLRVALPLQVGVRMIGVVVADCAPGVSAAVLHEVRARLSEHSLRLDTALVFDEVRTLATADERRRLAREIHDGIAQEVASIGYAVDEMIAGSSSPEQAGSLRALRHQLTRLVSELRLSIFDLRSGVSSNDGLGSVLGDYVREVGKNSGMTVHLSLEESPRRLRLDVETELLRIAQEAVTNARKHSDAANLWVTCRVEPPFAEIRIEDDGCGAVRAREDHYGLHMMQERATRINAVLTFADRPRGGTIISAVLLPADTTAIPESGESDALHRLAS